MVRDFYTTWKHMFIGLIGGKSVVWFFTGFHMFQLTCWRYFVKPKLWPNRFSPEIELQDLSPRPHRLQRKWMKDLLNGKSKICASIVVGYHRISCKNFFRRESSECLNVPRTKSSRNILTKKNWSLCCVALSFSAGNLLVRAIHGLWLWYTNERLEYVTTWFVGTNDVTQLKRTQE